MALLIWSMGVWGRKIVSIFCGDEAKLPAPTSAHLSERKPRKLGRELTIGEITKFGVYNAIENFNKYFWFKVTKSEQKRKNELPVVKLEIEHYQPRNCEFVEGEENKRGRGRGRGRGKKWKFNSKLYEKRTIMKLYRKKLMVYKRNVCQL